MEESGCVDALAEDDALSDVSGYHSDSDSAIMMSGNSPYVTKHARFNFLTRSGQWRHSASPFRSKNAMIRTLFGNLINKVKEMGCLKRLQFVCTDPWESWK